MRELLQSQNLMGPHGGKLVDRILTGNKKTERISEIKELPHISLNNELMREVENIAKGVFSPLEGFLIQDDYLSVLREGRLANGLPWTIPILLDAPREAIKGLRENDQIALTGASGKFLAS